MDERDLLRISTAGSVDDGKSTLIGRLLYDSKVIPDDTLVNVSRLSRTGGDSDELNLALLTDGLRAEREQQITIDVAYRYFTTEKRRFIIADTPGHSQYTRNMVTGASTAQVAIVLVDARNGILPQTRRHAAISSLLRVPKILLTVNKMDLVGFDEDVFRRIDSEFRSFASSLDVSIDSIPISALRGDNVVEKGESMPWFHGPTLIEYLTELPIPAPETGRPFRFQVQFAVRPHQDFRGFAGRVLSGYVAPGDHVESLVSGQSTRIRAVLSADGELPEAKAGQSVVLQLHDEIDISRGDVIAHSDELPSRSGRFRATLCWMSETPLKVGTRYVLLHLSRQLRATVEQIESVLDVDSMKHRPADSLSLNELGTVVIHTTKPLIVDPYNQNRATGGFLLVDAATNVPVAAGTVASFSESEGPNSLPDKVWTRVDRELRHGHRSVAVYIDAAILEDQLAALEWHLDQLGLHTAVVAPGNAEAFVENGIVALVTGGEAQCDILFGPADATRVAEFASDLAKQLRA